MSLESVRTELADIAPDLEIILSSVSTATVAEAAAAHGVEPGRIAKTLGLRVGEAMFLVVAAGDARLDNKKLRLQFGGKAKLLDGDAVESITGHPVGGVCPFGLLAKLPVYCDVSLRRFPTVIPAAGAVNASVPVATERLAAISKAEWVDVCQNIE